MCSPTKRSGSKRSGSGHRSAWRCSRYGEITSRDPAGTATSPTTSSRTASRSMVHAGGCRRVVSSSAARVQTRSSRSATVGGRSPSTRSTSASMRSRAAGWAESSRRVHVSAAAVVSWPAIISVNTSSCSSASVRGGPVSGLAINRSSRSRGGSPTPLRRRSATTPSTRVSRRRTAAPKRGTSRTWSPASRPTLPGSMVSTMPPIMPPCSMPSARPTGTARSASSAPKKTLPTTSRVSHRIRAATSTTWPWGHARRVLSTQPTMSSPNAVRCRWAKTGCTMRRCAAQASPSRVSRPSPSTARSGRYVGAFT